MRPNQPSSLDSVYELIADELEKGHTNKALWTRLYAELDGDERKVKAAYIRARIEQLEVTDQDQTAQNSLPIKPPPIEGGDIEVKVSSEKLDLLFGLIQHDDVAGMTKFIQDNGDVVNAKMTGGVTALHVATLMGSYELVNALVVLGASVAVESEQGQTAVDIAKTRLKVAKQKMHQGLTATVAVEQKIVQLLEGLEKEKPQPRIPASKPKQPTIQHTNFFSKFISGDYGLAVTYWGWGVVGSNVFFLIALSTKSDLLALCGVLYLALVLVAAWRAACKYAGPNSWRILGMTGVIFGWLNWLNIVSIPFRKSYY